MAFRSLSLVGIFCLFFIFGVSISRATPSAPALSFSPRWSLIQTNATFNPLKIVSGAGTYITYNPWGVGPAGVQIGKTQNGLDWSLVQIVPGAEFSIGTFSIQHGNGRWLLIGASSFPGSDMLHVYESLDSGSSWHPLISSNLSSFPVTSIGELYFFEGKWFIPVNLSTGPGLLASTDNGLTWSVAGNFSENIVGLAYGDGTLVGIGSLISNNKIYRSTDWGQTWSYQDTYINANLVGVAYGNGRFVIVSNSGHILTSIDLGVTWNSSAGVLSQFPSGIIFWNDMFILSNGKTSFDGLQWTTPSRWISSLNPTYTPPGPATPEPNAAIAGGNEGIMATYQAMGGGNPLVYQSVGSNAPTWVSTNYPTAVATLGELFETNYPANGADSFVSSQLPDGINLNTSLGIISGTPTRAGTDYLILYATNSYGASDPKIVTLRVAQPGGVAIPALRFAVRRIDNLFSQRIYSGGGTYFVFGSTGGYGPPSPVAGLSPFRKSQDGINWSQFSIPFLMGEGSANFTFAYGGGKWVYASGTAWGVSGSTPVIYESVDAGESWLRVTAGSLHSSNGGLTVEDLLFVDDSLVLIGNLNLGLGMGPNPGLWVSNDGGLNWIDRTPANSGSLKAAAFGDGTLVVINNGNGIFSTQNKGQTWNATTVDPAIPLIDIAFGNDRFVVIGSDGAIFTSTNGGIVWTPQHLRPNYTAPWESLGQEFGLSAIAFGDGRFVLSNGQSSQDGVIWTPPIQWFPPETGPGASGSTFLAHGPAGFVAVRDGPAATGGEIIHNVYQSVDYNAPDWSSANVWTQKWQWETPFQKTVEAPGATSFLAFNLPSWLSLDPSTGILSGLPPPNPLSGPGMPGPTTQGYIIPIYAMNSSGASDVAVFSLTLQSDVTPPVITLNGQNPMFWQVGTPFMDPGATVIDDFPISPGMIVISGLVDGMALGTYTLTYQITDSFGNQATPVIRTVHVVAEVPNTPPEIWANLTGTIQEGGVGQTYIGAVKVSDYQDPAASSPVLPPSDPPAPPVETTVVTIEGLDGSSFSWGISQMAETPHASSHFYFHQGLYLSQAADFETQTSYVAILKAVDKDGLVTEFPVSLLILNDPSSADDSDMDMLPDDWEVQWFGGLLAQTGAGDVDTDSLTNSSEYAYATNPTEPDTDGDGFADGTEVAQGKDPLDASSRPGKVFYVKLGATGTNDGSSWENAFTNLQDGLDATEQQEDEVWVAQGFYLPTAYIDSAATSDPRSKTFLILQGMRIYGGFSGNETALNQRNPTNHPTILSGDFSGNDTPAWPSLDSSRNENAYHVVTIFAQTTGQIVGLDGFTITGGNADNTIYEQPDNGSPIPVGYKIHMHGAAVQIHNMEVDLVNCRIEKNKAYGDAAVLVTGHEVGSFPALTIISQCVMSDNLCVSDFGNGAGLMVENYPRVDVVFSIFERNRARSGAAINIYHEGSSGLPTKVRVTDSEFRENVGFVSPDTDGDGYLNNGNGGAIFILGEDSELSIGSSVFENNRIDPMGLLDPSMEIPNGFGGALFAVGGSEVKIVNSVFVGNICQAGGGAIALARWSGEAPSPASVEIYFSTFTGNSSRWGGAVDNFLGQLSGFGNIFYNNPQIGGFVSDVNNGVSLTGEQSASSISYSLTTLGDFSRNTGTGIVAGNPRFIQPGDPDGPDNIWGNSDDGLAMAMVSPGASLVDVELPADFADVDGDGNLAEPTPWDFIGAAFPGRPYHAGAYQSLCTTGADQEAPVITLIGSNPMNIPKGAMFVDPGAVVRDNSDSMYVISGQGFVDIFTPGTYSLIYEATDLDGNAAVPVARIVNVVYPAEGILPPASVWEFTFAQPGPGLGWTTGTGVGGGWQTGPAPFGNTQNTHFNSSQGTYWPVDLVNGDDDLWVRKVVDFTGYDLSSAVWKIGVDNGYKLYVNGVLISSSWEEGFTYRWEYSGSFAGALVPGLNFIALALDDAGGSTAFDMEISASVNSNLDSDGDGLTDAWERGYGRYELVRGDWNFDTALADAAQRTVAVGSGQIRGHLATITSAGEQQFVHDFIEGQPHDDLTVDILLGASDGQEEGTWNWVTCEKWDYTHWYPGEPNNLDRRSEGEDFLSYSLQWNHTWVDVPYGQGWNSGYNPAAYLLEYGYPTDPYNPDSDGDGVNDLAETVAGTDPNDSQSNDDSHRPLITQQPTGGNGVEGGSLTLSVGALNPGPNLLSNSGFESGLDNWSADGGSAGHTTNVSYRGIGAATLTHPSDPTLYGRLVYSPSLTLSNGVSYLATAKVWQGYSLYDNEQSFEMMTGGTGDYANFSYVRLPLTGSCQGTNWSTVRSLITTRNTMTVASSLRLLNRHAPQNSTYVVDDFELRACSTNGLSYQWYKDGVAVAGATGVQLELTGLSATDAGAYRVVVSNAYGEVNSTTATVGVEPEAINLWKNDPRNLLPSFTNFGFDAGTFEQWSIRHDRTPWSLLIVDDPLAEGGKAIFFEEWERGVCVVSPNFTAVVGSYYEARLYRPGNISSCKAIVIAGSTPNDINIPLGHDHLAEVSVSSSTEYVTTRIDLTPFAGQVIRVGFFGGNLQADYAKVFLPNLDDWLGSTSSSSEMVYKYVFGGASGPQAESEPISLSRDSAEITLSVIVRTNDAKVSVWGEVATDLAGFSNPGTRQTISGTPSANQEGVPIGCQRQEFKLESEGQQRGFLRVRANISN